MNGGTARIDRRFERLKGESRAGLVTFITAGDPDLETSARILSGLPAAGADLIELGMPFTDPMADGPSIQLAAQRALKAGTTLARTLAMVQAFRQADRDTPIVLMGYYNPIYSYGVDRFLKDGREAGIDGLIIVDLPPEEDEELCLPALRSGLSFVRLATPTTDDARLPRVLSNTSGFVYYVSYAGITGAKAIDAGAVARAVARLRRHTGLPIGVGFGIRTTEQAALVARVADAVVIGSAIVDRVRDSLDAGGRPRPDTVDRVLGLVAELSAGVRDARAGAAVQAE